MVFVKLGQVGVLAWLGWSILLCIILVTMMTFVVTLFQLLASLDDCAHVYDFAEAFFGRNRQS